ncbi:SIR2 family NAD-dependent protein deacylase [Brumimicrobium aurantiacum]|uniref:NAD-dependent protein deacylase n=1 Tax=Brumimicrobium aurantiacum TaxID=1737063 RepID=A0A3E1F2C6_9FLAO|nr:NAD-dependent deacylase [Brumimicrobium aurantiacum]RFC55940.1 NAD-dependent deacylase [Brumimicrobium aurantiacum]
MGKERIIVFTGAGISAESGLGTFRDNGGLWEKYNIEEVATPEAWNKNPKMVTDFYNMRRKQCYEASPNAAHYAIAELENKYEVEVITQNVDNLHERSGSTNVLHLHGELNKVKSSGPNAEKTILKQDNWEVKMGDLCPEGYQLRPHVVWFGEAVPMLDKAVQHIKNADIVIVIGTSLNVYPAAGIIEYAPVDASYYLIDPNEVHVPSYFNVIQETATKGVVQLVNQLLA